MIKFAYQGSGWKNWKDKIGQYDREEKRLSILFVVGQAHVHTGEL